MTNKRNARAALFAAIACASLLLLMILANTPEPDHEHEYAWVHPKWDRVTMEHRFQRARAEALEYARAVRDLDGIMRRKWSFEEGYLWPELERLGWVRRCAACYANDPSSPINMFRAEAKRRGIKTLPATPAGADSGEPR